MASKNSTTPKSDLKMKLWRNHDAHCEYIDVTEEQWGRMRCKECNSRFRFVMSEYAMKSHDHNQHLMTCDCVRMVWFKRIEK